MTSAAETKLKKGETVFYGTATGTFRARVVVAHRDGTATVGALFEVDSAGRDKAGCLGFIYRRVARARLRTSFAA